MGQGGEDASGMVCWGLFTDAVIERERERERVEKGILASHVCIMHMQSCRSNLDKIFKAQTWGPLTAASQGRD